MSRDPGSVATEEVASTFLLHTGDDHDQCWSGLAYGGFPLFAATVLRAEKACVHTARNFTSDLLTQWNIDDDDKTSAVLIVGELTANAAQYGRASMAVSLALFDHTLGIKVTDFGWCVPRDQGCSLETEDEHGRGLSIVTFLADRVETFQEDWGRTVHVELGVSCTGVPVPRQD